MKLENLIALGFDQSRRSGFGSFTVRCSQCQALVICGVPTHEHGCPNTPRDEDDWEDFDGDAEEDFDDDAEME